MIPIEGPKQNTPFPFFALGFRPFFFAAGLSSVLLMLLWLLIYSLNIPLLRQQIAPQLWHAHEMIFGYAMAVIVGFLLTSVKNWTQVQTLNGKPLILLFGLWLGARFLPFVDVPLYIQAIVDSSFLVFSAVAIGSPIIQAKSWSNIGILSKVVLMAITHILFYLGLLGILEQGVHWGLYGAFYMILALIFVMARRVIPFFIQRSLNLEKPLTNYAWLDIASLLLFVLYLIYDVFYPSNLVYVTALSLLILHSIRLYHWYHKGIWSQPLLWSLYLAYASLVFAFGLKLLSYFSIVSPFINIHSFAFGIGFITIGMMSRVSLGHTGRDINKHPKVLNLAFIALALGYVTRIILPLINIENYHLWIISSQLLWASAFLIFCFIYIPMLFKPRVDGRIG